MCMLRQILVLVWMCDCDVFTTILNIMCLKFIWMHLLNQLLISKTLVHYYTKVAAVFDMLRKIRFLSGSRTAYTVYIRTPRGSRLSNATMFGLLATQTCY